LTQCNCDVPLLTDRGEAITELAHVATGDRGGRDLRRWVSIGVVVVACAVLAAGGYLLGHAGGGNIANAIRAGGRRGELAGRLAGERRGYAAGVRSGAHAGRRIAYERSFSAAYARAVSR
jgi:hypothetical protein